MKKNSWVCRTRRQKTVATTDQELREKLARIWELIHSGTSQQILVPDPSLRETLEALSNPTRRRHVHL
jgi:hypothetical protein